MNSLEIRASVTLALVYVLRMLGLFMVMPVIAVLATDYQGYSALLLGLAIGGYGLTQAVLQIPMGVLSDRWGRKPVIIAGLLLFALGSAIAGQADSMWALVLGRFLQGTGAIAGAIMALAGDVSRENQRPKVMAVIGISIGFSFYLSLLIGPAIADNYGLAGIFYLTSVFALACIPLIIFVVPNSTAGSPQGDTLPKLSELGGLFAHPQLSRLNISVFVLHLLITLLFVQLPGYLLNLGWPLDSHWQIYLPVLLIAIFVMGALMQIAKRAGQSRVLQLSVILLIMAFAGLAWQTDTFAWLFIFVCLFFIGFNYLEANFPALVSTIAPAGKKGSAMGIFASFQFFGAFVGGLVSASLADWLGNTEVLMLAAAISALWLALLPKLENSTHLKRYSLHIDGVDMLKIQSTLRELTGVVDLQFNQQEHTLYLKLDTQLSSLADVKKHLGIG